METELQVVKHMKFMRHVTHAKRTDFKARIERLNTKENDERHKTLTVDSTDSDDPDDPEAEPKRKLMLAFAEYNRQKVKLMLQMAVMSYLVKFHQRDQMSYELQK